MRSPPYSCRIVRRSDGVYFCKVYSPYTLVEAINNSFPNLATRYAVNIGAGDGKSCYDPVYPLFRKGFAGLAVEWEDNRELYNNLPSEKVKKLTGVCVTPENAPTILSSSGCPRECDILKIDIDGYDGVILETILRHDYRPKVIQMEINPEFPPPIEFSVLYHEDYRALDSQGRIGGFYGASLSYVLRIAGDYGYRLACIDFVTPWTHDVTLVKKEFIDIAAGIFGDNIKTMSARELFLCQPPGYSHFAEYGIDSSAWRYRTDYHILITEIQNACMKADEIKHQGSPVPFHLLIGIDDNDNRDEARSSFKLPAKERSRDCRNIWSVHFECAAVKGWNLRSLISKIYIKLAQLRLLLTVAVRNPVLGLRFAWVEAIDDIGLVKQVAKSSWKLVFRREKSIRGASIVS